MKQLAIEFIKEHHRDKLLEYGFRKVENDYGNDYIYGTNKPNRERIIVFSDMSIDVTIKFDRSLSLLLNLIEDKIIRVYEE